MHCCAEFEVQRLVACPLAGTYFVIAAETETELVIGGVVVTELVMEAETEGVGVRLADVVSVKVSVWVCVRVLVQVPVPLIVLVPLKVPVPLIVLVPLKVPVPLIVLVPVKVIVELRVAPWAHAIIRNKKNALKILFMLFFFEFDFSKWK